MSIYLQFQFVSYLVSVGVAPLPQLLEQPQSVRVNQGDMVQLSCKVSGFANVTVVQWMKNHVDLESDSTNGEYTTRRENVDEDVFVETLQFFAHSAAFGGNYSCCLGVRNDSSDRTLSTTRLNVQSGEVDCGTFYGVVTVTGKMNGWIVILKVIYKGNMCRLTCRH